MRGASLAALADQSLWTVTNLALVIFIARTSSPADFGVFAVAYAFVVLGVGIVNPIAGEYVAVSLGAAARDWDSKNPIMKEQMHVSYAVGSVYAVASLLALVGTCIVALLGIQTPLLQALFVAGGVAVLAEGFRSLLYALRLRRVALRMSVVWFVAQAVGLAFVYLIERVSPSVVVMVWGFGAACAVAFTWGEVSWRPRVRGHPARFVRRQGAYAAEYLATALPAQALVLLSAALIGLPAAGSMRVLQTLFGPINIVIGALRLVLLPETTRAPADAFRISVRLAALSIAAVSAATFVAAAMPGLGTLFFGANWHAGWSLIVAFGLGRMAVGVTTSVVVYYRAHDLGKQSVIRRLLTAVLTTLGFLAGSTFSLETAVWSSSIGGVLAAAVWWWMPWTRRVA